MSSTYTFSCFLTANLSYKFPKNSLFKEKNIIVK